MQLKNGDKAISKPKIRIYAGLVCPRRSLDCKKLEKYFVANGCEICDNGHEATDIILITCGFIERNIIESLDLIKKLKRMKGRLIVGGCLIDIDAQRLARYFQGPTFSTRMIHTVEEFFPDFDIRFENFADANEMHDYNDIDRIIGRRKHYKEKYFFDRYALEIRETPFVIRVGYGCNSRCAYCSHRNAIGPYRSKHWEKCIEEFISGCKGGFSVFKITSMDIGKFGMDFGKSLPELLKRFVDIKGDAKFILEDINPMWLMKYAAEIRGLCENKSIKIIQTPIQSGSEEILKKMRRTYSPEKLNHVLKSFKKADPHLHIATEIIIGFPTETENDFAETKEFIVDSGIDFTYVYPYYENRYIESYKIFPKCIKGIIHNRLYRIQKYFEQEGVSYCIFTK
jgi:threonylcarbamoyladenosine tRNA methylthiotransferase CDKAL1